MRRFTKAILSLAACYLATFGSAQAADAPAPDAATMNALQRMGVYLRSLPVFSVDAITTDEDVLDDGQKVQYSGVTMVLVKKPNKMRAEVTNDFHQRLYFYDGSHFTLYGERVNYYATVPAPPTLQALANKLDEEYDFTVPLEDLILWGASGWDAKAVKDATDIGPTEIGGVTCEHYLVRQDDVDWQVWLQQGEFPLPRKIVITSRTDEARPQHTAIFTWNLAPSFNDETFVFTPPPDAKRVVLPGNAGTANAPAAATKP